ncbi:MAG: methyltransferase domain-containing protein [candidate division NC10 bacterium]|nr:methyltransferase domain-containing protein [candidate division NC10 bacterium]
MEDHRQVVRRQFRKQAHRFEGKGLTLSSQEYLQWMADNLDLQPHFDVLDVAAGTGLLSRAMAPHVARVVALDLTPEMLLQGRSQAKHDGLTNIVFVQGLAEDLPYPNDSFNRVVSRFSIHHFEDPQIQVKEMVRVCRPGGKVAIIDLVSPDDGTLAATYNRLERLRDPSHTRALLAGELRSVMQTAGLEIVHTVSREVEVNVTRWMDLTAPGPKMWRTILEELTEELKGGRITGMRPFMRDNELMFIQTWVIVVGVKR